MQPDHPGQQRAEIGTPNGHPHPEGLAEIVEDGNQCAYKSGQGGEHDDGAQLVQLLDAPALAQQG